jgi:hypothetical protein
MGRTVEAEYMAEQNVLKLAEPLSGISDHEKVEVEIRQVPAGLGQPWLKLAGSLNDEDGRTLAKSVREAFGRDEIEV